MGNSNIHNQDSLYSCEHCGLDFRQKRSSYQLHVPICEENPINTTLPCDFCTKPYDLTKLACHIQHCELNPKNLKVICEHCDHQVHFEKYQEHANSCSSNPACALIKCEFCNRNLTVGNHVEQLESCRGNPENIKIRCDYCGKKFNGLYFNQHYDECFKVYQNSESAKECSICLLELRTLKETEVLNCRHRFHKTCIKDWLGKQNSCPVCREVVASSST